MRIIKLYVISCNVGGNQKKEIKTKNNSNKNIYLNKINLIQIK